MLVKSFPAQNQKFVSFNLTDQVSLEQWDKDFIRIEISITADNISEKILKRLIMLGRYEVSVDREKLEMTLSMPKTKHVIMISGENLEESLSFKISVPKGMVARVNNVPTLASR